MICPRCKNAGFQPVPGIQKPLIQLRTEKMETITLRDYVCLQCGYVFNTEEKFFTEINIRGAKIMKMIDDAQDVIKQSKKEKREKEKVAD